MTKLLSVCLIVKNEQDVLERCLNSIRNLADEIIIVDTGSTDSTKAIALKYTSNIYDFKWVNDFSAARNESLRHATGKWILVLDADEYINPADAEQFRWFLQETDALDDRVYSISVVSYLGKSVQNANITTAPIPRLIPNGQGIVYQRPIHEQLTDKNGEILAAYTAPITVFHTGYLQDMIDSRNKSERNRQIFTALKEKTGFTPYDHFTIGNEHAIQGDFKKALYSYERALSKAESNNPWRWNCAFDMVSIYTKQDRLSEALEVVNRIFSTHLEYPEYYCLLGLIYEYAGLNSQARLNYLSAYEKADKLSQTQDTFWLINPEYGTTVPLIKLVHIAQKENNLTDLVLYSTKLLQINPYNYPYLLNLLEILTVSETTESIIGLMEKLYPENKQSDYFMLLRISIGLGQQELARYYREKLNDQITVMANDEMKWSLIEQDQVRFTSAVQVLPQPVSSQESILLLYLGSQVFGNSDVVAKQSIHPNSHPYLEQLSTLNSSVIQDDWIHQHSAVIFTYLSELLILKQYDLFDSAIGKLQHPVIINQLAGYFYRIGRTDLAIDYFNLLADWDSLNAINHVNFAILHFKNNLVTEGIPWLTTAIEMEPHNREFYGLLFTWCQDQDTLKEFKKRYLSLSSHLAKMPAIQKL
ncbi:hypothetical protein A7K91_06245 [Paenibacillus oryzae]|uniref:Glycosyltransferase 2-like domain-containing protein n=1 Tax=Paenibacillus oryzae TaxID=1844972 RepID=A0A1A5YDS7_9BACL|nr:glycosyltransferase family 2 protein [Paenibacillus oryzae]OBR63550.1 hypothetical protein A7K91_06245 [Paenibacillus oryzae]